MPLPPLVDVGPELTPDEVRRTSRQWMLSELGEAGQRRLAAARVLVIGAGGIGSPVLLYLTAAGVGTIGIIDDDRVETSNLQRQVIHAMTDVGSLKVDSAASTLAGLHPGISVQTHPVRFDSDNGKGIAAGYDLVIDGSDNFDTRYAADDVCAALGIPLIWGAVLRFDAQLSVFWAHPPVGAGVRLRDLFPVPPAPGEVPSCSEAGVLGALCGQAGSIMAAEAVKLITGVGESLLGRVLVIDALSARTREVAITASPVGALRPPAQAPASASAHIDTDALAARLAARDRGEDSFLLLDVREPSEHAERAIPGSVLHPLGEVLRDPSTIDIALPVIVHCLVEARAERAAAVLSAAGADVTVLRGGITAWGERS